MKEWMTAAEIAAAALPELPSTKRGVSMRAATEGWDTNPAYARKRDGKGGGFEYHFRLLPTLAQVEYMQRHMTVAAESRDLVAGSPSVEATPQNLTGRAREERDARLAIVAAFERFAAGLPRLRQASHLQLFTDKYDMGTLAIDGWVKDLVPSIGKRTLQRWLADKKAGRVDALAVDRGQARKGTGVLDVADNGKVRTLILALLAQNAHYSAAHIRGEVLALIGPQLWVPYKGSGPDMLKAVPVPPIRTFQHFIAALKSENKVALLKLTDPDRYRSTMAPSGVGALQHIQRPNQLWQIDASPVDALCVDGRHSVYVCIDIFTRRAVLLVSRTPKAAAVAQLLRKAIIAWGVPEAIKTDNGSDFVAHDTKRLMLSLGIEHQLYGIVGVEMNVYFNELISGNAPKVFDVSADITTGGRHQNERWTYTPGAAAADKTLTVKVHDPDHLTLLAQASAALDIVAANAAGGAARKVMCIGDSNTDAAIYTQRLLDRSAANASGVQVTLVGTRGIGPNYHEGRGGWAAINYFETKTLELKDNAFIQNDGDRFNFAYYLSSTGFTAPDIVVWALGTNDVFGATSDTTAHLAMDSYITRMDKMIGIVEGDDDSQVGSVIESSPTTKHIITLPPPPAFHQDAFANNVYDAQFRARFKRNIVIAAHRINQHYRGKEASGIFLLPFNAVIDPVNGFPFDAAGPANANTTRTVERQNNSVHPATTGFAGGYGQMGDALWACINVLVAKGWA